MKRVNPHKVLHIFVARYGSQEAAARALGITQPYLNDILHGKRAITDRILGKLRLRRVVVASR